MAIRGRARNRAIDSAGLHERTRDLRAIHVTRDIGDRVRLRIRRKCRRLRIPSRTGRDVVYIESQFPSSVSPAPSKYSILHEYTIISLDERTLMAKLDTFRLAVSIQSVLFINLVSCREFR